MDVTLRYLWFCITYLYKWFFVWEFQRKWSAWVLANMQLLSSALFCWFFSSCCTFHTSTAFAVINIFQIYFPLSGGFIGLPYLELEVLQLVWSEYELNHVLKTGGEKSSKDSQTKKYFLNTFYLKFQDGTLFDNASGIKIPWFEFNDSNSQEGSSISRNKK